MAESQDLDLDAQPTGGGNKKLIIIVVLAIIMVGASVGLTIWLVGGKGDSGEGEGTAVAAIPKAHYMPLDNMVVNFAQRGPARFLQVELQLMAHDPTVFRVVETHMPVIRNDLLALLGVVSYEQMSTREGKEVLNQAILDAINGILAQHGGGQIQAVYFTSFIMQ